MRRFARHKLNDDRGLIGEHFGIGTTIAARGVVIRC